MTQALFFSWKSMASDFKRPMKITVRKLSSRSSTGKCVWVRCTSDEPEDGKPNFVWRSQLFSWKAKIMKLVRLLAEVIFISIDFFGTFCIKTKSTLKEFPIHVHLVIHNIFFFISSFKTKLTLCSWIYQIKKGASAPFITISESLFPELPLISLMWTFRPHYYSNNYMYPEPRVLPAHIIININYHQQPGKKYI